MEAETIEHYRAGNHTPSISLEEEYFLNRSLRYQKFSSISVQEHTHTNLGVYHDEKEDGTPQVPPCPRIRNKHCTSNFNFLFALPSSFTLILTHLLSLISLTPSFTIFRYHTSYLSLTEDHSLHLGPSQWVGSRSLLDHDGKLHYLLEQNSRHSGKIH